MKLTINQTNNTVSSVTDTRIVQNSSGINYVYIYGVASGQVVKCTFRKPDGNLVGPINSVYDHDADNVACFVCIIPSTALTLAGDIGVSVAVYSAPFWQASIISYWAAHGTEAGTYDIGPSKVLADLPTAPSVETAARVNTGTSPAVYEYYVSKVNIQTTVRSTGFIYSSDTVEFPDELATEITNDLYARYNNIIAGNVALDALNVTGNAAIGGTLAVTGNSSFGNIAASGLFAGASETLSGSLSIGTNFIANGSASVGTTLTVGTLAQFNGGANFASGVNIIGNVTAGNVAINGASSHVGNATFGNVSASGAIVGASIVSNAAVNAASLNLTGNAAIGGNAVINGSLTVIGASNLATCTISGDDMDMNNNQIINVGNGSADGDAVNIGQLTLSLAYKQDVSEKDQANGYAGLNSVGKLANSVIPALALVDTFTAASEVAQLALSTAAQGDICIRSDENKSYVHNGGTAGTMDDWTLLSTPTDTVLSVNGETGAVTIDAPDIAYSPTVSGLTATNVKTALDEIDSNLDTAQTEIDTLQSDMDTAQADITTVEGQINALATTSVGMQDLLARQQPTTELSLATPTTAIARKVANINRFHFKGLTFKNLVKNGNFVNTANWTVASATLSVANNIATLLATAQAGRLSQTFSVISGHVYYISFDVKLSVASTRVVARINLGSNGDYNAVSTTEWQTISTLRTAASTTTGAYIYLWDNTTSNWASTQYRDVKIVDLTELGTHPSGVHWHDMTASQIDAFIGNLDTTSQIVAKAIAGGETNKVTNGTFTSNITGYTAATATTEVSFDNGSLKGLSIGAGGNFQVVYGALNFTFTAGKVYSIKMKLSANQNKAIRLYYGSNILYDFGSTWTSTLTEVSAVVSITTTTANAFVFDLRIASAAAGDYLHVDDIEFYDITSYYRTADLISFSPLNITCSDGVTTLSTALASALNPSSSLPDGQADEFDFYVEDDPADADFQSRMMEKTTRTLRINLPDAQVGGVDKWQLGKVGTTAARFFCRLEDLAIASGHTLIGATRCYRIGTIPGSFPSANGWARVGASGSYTRFTFDLIAGLETWATSAIPTILWKSATLPLVSLDTLDTYAAVGAALSADSTKLHINVVTISYDDLEELNNFLTIVDSLSVVIPYDTYGANVENIYTSHLAYALSTFNDHCADAASLAYYEDYDNLMHYISLKLPVATADTLAELYTYLVANPLSVIVEIADEVDDITQSYVKQTGNALTLGITSNSAAQAGAFDATVATDLDVVLAAIVASIPS